MILNNQDDKDDFQKSILSSLFGIGGWEKKGNISQAYEWLHRKINLENALKIYENLMNNFYFSLIIVDEETNPWEVFMALNTTGMELNISDLVKSLFVSQSDTKYEQKRIFDIWVMLQQNS